MAEPRLGIMPHVMPFQRWLPVTCSHQHTHTAGANNTEIQACGGNEHRQQSCCTREQPGDCGQGDQDSNGFTADTENQLCRAAWKQQQPASETMFVSQPHQAVLCSWRHP
jgi:hypothetical protein